MPGRSEHPSGAPLPQAQRLRPAIVPITSRFAQKGLIISARLAKPRQTETRAYR